MPQSSAEIENDPGSASKRVVYDKHGLLSRATNESSLVLELGCGPIRREPGRIGVDQLDYPEVDIVGDVFDVLGQLSPGSVSAIYASHFLEHVTELDKLLKEIARVLVTGGLLDIEVPHFSNPYFYSDPTHVRPFGLYTFSYLAEAKIFRRAVPRYGLAPKFVLEDVDLFFTSPFLARKIIRRLIGPIFNATRWLQEFYEENLCYLFPAHEIHFVLKKL
jgi:SAM-dependent methyltransferase